MILPVTLFVAYIVLTHAAVVTGHDRLAVGSLLALVIAILLPLARRGGVWAYATLVVASAVVLLLPPGNWTVWLLFLPPVLINLALAWLFGRSLFTGNVALVERFVRMMHHPDDVLDPEVFAYARAVTKCWTALFCFNAAVCALLALTAYPGGMLDLAGLRSPIEVPTIAWTLYSDFGCYAVALLLFVVEYQVRKRRFPWQPYSGFFDFLRKAGAVAPAILGSNGPVSVTERRWPPESKIRSDE